MFLLNCNNVLPGFLYQKQDLVLRERGGVCVFQLCIESACDFNARNL